MTRLNQRSMPEAPTVRSLLPGTLRKNERVEIEREASFSSSDVKRVKSGYLLNLSTTGMFIETRDLGACGKELLFEFSLTKGQRPVRGAAEVVWVRRYEERLPRRRPGMGLRFLDLDDDSGEQIDWLVARRKQPGNPNRLGLLADEPGPSACEPARSDRVVEKRPSQRSSNRAPVGKSIELLFDDSRDVVKGWCEDVSIGGMSIQLQDTRSRGMRVRFDLQINEGTAIRGLGEVVWNRGTAAGPGREAGIGIKFRVLDDNDQQLIREVVRMHADRLAKARLLPAPGAATAAAR